MELLKFVLKVPINKMPVLVQTMASRRLGNKPSSEPVLVYFNGIYIHHPASMSYSRSTAK